ncbi:MAG TPA: DUF6677 family protein [Pirellulales bacterium]|nr:DUF6677 family protein [Pirellulales bacterium]
MAKNQPTRDAGRPSGTFTPEGVPLRDPFVGALLAWLIPGGGHWYQGRRSKAVLFFVCILGTFLYGLYLGEGRVVYASMRPEDRRFPYFCQVGAGAVALPALVQAYRVNHGSNPIPFPGWTDFMVPPSVEKNREDLPSELDLLHKRLNRFFELGTVYTMVAGLLNVLVIYDAWAGPAEPDLPAKKEDEEEGKPVATGPPQAS